MKFRNPFIFIWSRCFSFLQNGKTIVFINFTASFSLQKESSDNTEKQEESKNHLEPHYEEDTVNFMADIHLTIGEQTAASFCSLPWSIHKDLLIITLSVTDCEFC